MQTRAALLMAFALVSMDLSYLLIDTVVQPAHWLRVYPLAMLIAAGTTIELRERRHAQHAMALFAGALLLVAVMDSFLCVKSLGNSIVSSRMAPAIIDSEMRSLISGVSEIQAGTITFLRGCDSKYVHTTGPEYALSAMTSHETGFGHVYFSPGVAEKLHSRILCEDAASRAGEFMGKYSIVISDAGLSGLLHIEATMVIGQFEVFDTREIRMRAQYKALSGTS